MNKSEAIEIISKIILKERLIGYRAGLLKEDVPSILPQYEISALTILDSIKEFIGGHSI